MTSTSSLLAHGQAVSIAIIELVGVFLYSQI